MIGDDLSLQYHWQWLPVIRCRMYMQMSVAA
jgi:hypothetical protein